MALICHTLNGIYYNAFLLSKILKVFKIAFSRYTLAFNTHTSLFFLNLDILSHDIYTECFVLLLNILFGYISNYVKLNNSMAFC